MALARLLATLHDDAGNVAVAGVSSGDWDGSGVQRGGLPGQRRPARRRRAHRARARRRRGSGRSPSINAIGVDMTSIAGVVERAHPRGRGAKISMRIVPGSDPEKELDALVAHLESHAPWGAQVEVKRTKAAPPFRCETDGPGYAAAREALERGLRQAGRRGRLRRLHPAAAHAPGRRAAAPSSSCGVPRTSPAARIHASDESVDPSEIERMVVAQALLLQRPRRAGVTRLDERPPTVATTAHAGCWSSPACRRWWSTPTRPR